MGEPDWLDDYLPINGKPLVLFLLVGLILVYELSITGQKLISCKVSKIDGKVEDVLKQMEINRLIHAVNGLYGRFETSGDVFIDNEYTIKELSELTDMRERLQINSYTQGRLNYLVSKIKRG